jgi:tRNA modification GTPase
MRVSHSTAPWCSFSRGPRPRRAKILPNSTFMAVAPWCVRLRQRSRRYRGSAAREPGEFTRRALIHGRIDLTEAEGLGDLLAAETEMQRRTALRAAEGGVRSRIETWATRTLRLSALVEAMLDHGDEDDVAGEGDILATVQHDAVALAAEIEATITQPPVERIRDGIRIVLAGAPNAGKSTLLNALAGREAAIVSPLAGTTRDRIEVPVMRDGIAYLLTDTAGLHAAPVDIVEEIGIARARSAIESADLILWLDDAPLPAELAKVPHLLIHPRADAPGRDPGAAGRLAVSAETGAGGRGAVASGRRAFDRLAPGSGQRCAQHPPACAGRARCRRVARRRRPE